MVGGPETVTGLGAPYWIGLGVGIVIVGGRGHAQAHFAFKELGEHVLRFAVERASNRGDAGPTTRCLGDDRFAVVVHPHGAHHVTGEIALTRPVIPLSPFGLRAIQNQAAGAAEP